MSHRSKKSICYEDILSNFCRQKGLPALFKATKRRYIKQGKMANLYQVAVIKQLTKHS
uniref:Uncharacterized protein n=1 Tax=Arundo donax TaxID=35708 RepID=A0A0A9CST1_ARUDO